jgi:uncharacterized protein YebE (UPF0316 family)
MTVPWETILGALWIFSMRVCDVTLGTMRLIILARGMKYRAAVLGFFEVMIFVVATGAVVRGVSEHWWNIIAYAAGFAVGSIVGVTLEERLALGFSIVRVFTRDKGVEMAAALREANCGATEIFGQGRDGLVSIVETAVRRRDIPGVEQVVGQVDDQALVVVDEARGLFHGYFRGRNGGTACKENCVLASNEKPASDTQSGGCQLAEPNKRTGPG